MDPSILNTKLKVLWLGCGSEDAIYGSVKAMEDLLTEKKVKQVFNPSGGGHSWPNWQVYLSKFTPLLRCRQRLGGLLNYYSRAA